VVDPPHNTFYPESWGSDTSSDDTAAVQACLDAAKGGTCLLSAASYSVSNLRMGYLTALVGTGMRNTMLTRLGGSSGPMIREKTTGEGNPYGASGITIRDLAVVGNGTSGDGISLGNQTSGYQFTSRGVLERVESWGFPQGAGFNLNSNAESFYYLWSFNNQTGFYLHGGGANQYYSLYAERNSGYQINVADPWNFFSGTQLEDNGAGVSGSNPFILSNAGQNTFNGVYINQGDQAKPCLVKIAAQSVVRDLVGTGTGSFTNAVCGPSSSSGGSRFVREFGT
jgi:hypothetical protein